MTASTLVRLTPTAPAHGGTCIAHDEDGHPVFVSHTAPGETVRARVHTQRSKVAFADAVEILTPNEHRRPHFWSQAGPGGVGGADLGHLTEEYQRWWKGQVIGDQIRRVGGATLAAHLQSLLGAETGGEYTPVVRPASGDETGLALHRRRRIECEVSERGRLAMRPENSKELIDLEDMPLADESLLELSVWADTRWRRIWHPGARVRLLAPNDGGRRITVGNQAFNAAGRRVRPLAQWQVTHSDHTAHFEVSATGFWQAHRSAPNDLVETVMRLARPAPGEWALELYAGAGLFSYFLARAIGENGRLVTLEGAGAAVSDARNNLAAFADSTRLLRANVNARAVARGVETLGGYPDLVVLDPPRAGAGKAVIEAIGESGARRVVLVSCDPAAGARDCAQLLQAGFTVGGLEAIDLFPQTHHVEIVSLWER